MLGSSIVSTGIARTVKIKYISILPSYFLKACDILFVKYF